MSKIEQLVPEQEFEHKGVKLKAVEVLAINFCKGCVFDSTERCGAWSVPCTNGSIVFPKQKHDLIFIQTDKQNEEHN